MATLASPAPSRERMSADRAARLEPGTAIEVRNRFDRRWAKGFEVSASDAEGYRVRRLSDGQELPTVFSTEDVRRHRDRSRNTWWY